MGRTPRKFQQAAAEAIAEARKSAGLTKAGLADRLDRPKTYIWKIEAGERTVTAYDVFIIARALRLTGAELMARVEKRL